MGFLPDKYETPETPSRFMSLEEGKNTIRVLSPAVVGWEWWTEDKAGNRKPNRVKTEEGVPSEIKNTTDNRKRAKHFWAFVVYNFEVKYIQILQLTQKTIMRSIEALVNDENWGDPKEYSIVITKTKTGTRKTEVEYSIMPQPKKEIDKKILENYKALSINLETLFENGSPFEQPDEGEALAEEVAEEIE